MYTTEVKIKNSSLTYIAIMIALGIVNLWSIAYYLATIADKISNLNLTCPSPTVQTSSGSEQKREDMYYQCVKTKIGWSQDISSCNSIK